MKSSTVFKNLVALFLVTFSVSTLSIPISYSVQGHGAITYFGGQVQESVLTYFGRSGNLDITAGTSLSDYTHGVSFNTGANDGSSFGPSETYTFQSLFTINGITQTMTQQGSYSQIGNGQFQFRLLNSDVLFFDLGSDGLLTVSTIDTSSQTLQNLSSQSDLFRTSFSLSAVAVSEPSSIGLFAMGLLALARSRKKLSLKTS